MSALDELLAPYRAAESRDDLVIVVDDPVAVRVLACWRRVEIAWRQPQLRRPDSLGALWVWIWRGVRYDRAALAVAAGVGEDSAGRYAHALQTARLIYPDATITKHAATLVADHVRTRHPGKRAGRAPGQRDTKPRAKRRTQEQIRAAAAEENECE